MDRFKKRFASACAKRIYLMKAQADTDVWGDHNDQWDDEADQHQEDDVR